MNRIFFLLLLLFVVCNRPVFAEGRCPPGYFETNLPDFYGCAPDNSPKLADPGGQMSLPPALGPQWAYRYGAIAIDDAKGRFGGVDGQADQRKARKAAIKLCRTNGGSKCKIVMEYYNQCGALAWGADKYVAFRGPVVDELTKRGIESCNRLTSNCQIYFVGCSYPVEK